jgi:hypothetical protein
VGNPLEYEELTGAVSDTYVQTGTIADRLSVCHFFALINNNMKIDK